MFFDNSFYFHIALLPVTSVTSDSSLSAYKNILKKPERFLIQQKAKRSMDETVQGQ